MVRSAYPGAAGDGIVELNAESLPLALTFEKKRSREQGLLFLDAELKALLLEIILLQEQGLASYLMRLDAGMAVSRLIEVLHLDYSRVWWYFCQRVYTLHGYRNRDFASDLVQASFCERPELGRKIMVPKRDRAARKFAERRHGYKLHDPPFILYERIFWPDEIAKLRGIFEEGCCQPRYVVRPLSWDDLDNVAERLKHRVDPILGLDRPKNSISTWLEQLVASSNPDLGLCYVMKFGKHLNAFAHTFVERSPLTDEGLDDLWIRCPFSRPSLPHVGNFGNLLNGIVVQTSQRLALHGPLRIRTFLPERATKLIKNAREAYFHLGFRCCPDWIVPEHWESPPNDAIRWPRHHAEISRHLTPTPRRCFSPLVS